VAPVRVDAGYGDATVSKSTHNDRTRATGNRPREPPLQAVAFDVLLVEDDVDVRETLGIALTDEGYRAALVSDGLSALEWLRTHPKPRLILLDWMMPRRGGESFLRQRALDPAFADVPTVVVTADSRVRAAAAVRSVAAVLLKPVDLDTILATVRRYCS
jgi:CheY-like chemotaxis protein